MRKFFLSLIILVSLPSVADTVLVYGDSLSAGYGLANEDSGWVALLDEKLGASHQVLNASISGETSRGGLSRLPAVLDRMQPDVVILELGANDGLRGYPLSQLETNLNKMIDLIEQANAKVLLVGIHLPPNYGPAYTEPFFELFKTISEQRNVAYLPFLLDAVALQANLMQGDGLHPNDAAQPVIRDTVLPYLRPLLEATQ